MRRTRGAPNNVGRWLTPRAGDFILFVVSATPLLRQPALHRGDAVLSIGLLFLIWSLILYVLGLYELRLIRNFVLLVENLLASAVLCLASGIACIYALWPYTNLRPKPSLVVTVLAFHALILLWRRAWLWLLRFNFWDQSIVFLGDESEVKEIETSLRLRFEDSGFRPVPWQWPGVDLVVADDRWVEEHWSDARVVFLAALSRAVPIVSYENFYESLFGKVSPHNAGAPSWALEFALPKRVGVYWRFKRLIDIVGAATLLFLLSPVLAATAALIAIREGGTVFFGQERAGFMGKPFTVWKFRTMTADAESAGPFSSAHSNAARVTPLGAILRRFRLDELPQLWNVLRGEMSLVGPRPEWTREVAVLENAVPCYHLRHLVYPGITGWAQVYFRATNNVEDSIEKCHFDLFYVKYLSFALDVTILLKTIKRILLHDLKVEPIIAPTVSPHGAASSWSGDLASAFKSDSDPINNSVAS